MRPLLDKNFHRNKKNLLSSQRDEINSLHVDHHKIGKNKPYALPALDTSYRGKNSSHQDSVRTTLSEPIRGSRISQQFIERSSSRAASPGIDLSRQPPYNTQGMIGLLRLERSTREKKFNADYSTFWEWGTKGSSDQQAKPSKLEGKIARVKHMQKLYTSNLEQLPSTSESNQNIEAVGGNSSDTNQGGGPSNSLLFSQQTEMTDADIMLVSKYFKPGAVTLNGSTKYTQSDRVVQTSEEATLSSRPVSTLPSTTEGEPNEAFSAASNDRNPKLSISPQLDLQSPMTPGAASSKNAMKLFSQRSPKKQTERKLPNSFQLPALHSTDASARRRPPSSLSTSIEIDPRRSLNSPHVYGSPPGTAMSTSAGAETLLKWSLDLDPSHIDSLY